MLNESTNIPSTWIKVPTNSDQCYVFLFRDLTMWDLLTPSPNSAAALLTQATNNAHQGAVGVLRLFYNVALSGQWGIKCQRGAPRYPPHYLQTTADAEKPFYFQRTLVKRYHWLSWPFHWELRLRMFLKCSVWHSNPAECSLFVALQPCYNHPTGPTPGLRVYSPLFRSYREGYIYHTAVIWF